MEKWDFEVLMKKQKMHERDRISDLPDEILILIITRLPSRDAIRTSLLSHRWKTLWRLAAPGMTILNFDASKRRNVMRSLGSKNVEIEIESDKLVFGVNKLLESNTMSEIEEFTFSFFILPKHSIDIDNWITIAAEKGVQRLELNFSKLWHGYNFPKYIPNLYSRLRELNLKRVKISQQALESLFSNAHSIENLSLALSSGFEKLNLLPSQCPVLQKLLIFFCFGLEDINIISAPELNHLGITLSSLCTLWIDSAPKLHSLHFNSIIHDMSIMFAPQLTEAFFGSFYTTCLIHLPDLLWQYQYPYAQLKKLKLFLCLEESDAAARQLCDLPVSQLSSFINLQQLVLTIGSFHCKQSILWPCVLVKAAPYLSKLTIIKWQRQKEQYMMTQFVEQQQRKPYKRTNIPKDKLNKLREAAMFTHKCLKMVNLKGFTGKTSDVELALHLVTIAVSLKKITFDTRIYEGIPHEFRTQCVEATNSEVFRKHAQRLKAKIDPEIEVAII